jgi:hypothetical protein
VLPAGRSSRSNPSGRFEQFQTEEFDDDWSKYEEDQIDRVETTPTSPGCLRPLTIQSRAGPLELRHVVNARRSDELRSHSTAARISMRASAKAFTRLEIGALSVVLAVPAKGSYDRSQCQGYRSGTE